MTNAIHTSDVRHFKRMWLAVGGAIKPQRRTGEVRYCHPQFIDTIRANDRRKDVPAVLLSRLNQLIRPKNTQYCILLQSVH
jgi:hypothetical protein